MNNENVLICFTCKNQYDQNILEPFKRAVYSKRIEKSNSYSQRETTQSM